MNKFSLKTCFPLFIIFAVVFQLIVATSTAQAQLHSDAQAKWPSDGGTVPFDDLTVPLLIIGVAVVAVVAVIIIENSSEADSVDSVTGDLTSSSSPFIDYNKNKNFRFEPLPESCVTSEYK